MADGRVSDFERFSILNGNGFADHAQAVASARAIIDDPATISSEKHQAVAALSIENAASVEALAERVTRLENMLQRFAAALEVKIS